MNKFTTMNLIIKKITNKRYLNFFLLISFLFSIPLIGCGGSSDDASNDNESSPENPAAPRSANLDSCNAFRNQPFKILDGEECSSSTSSLVRIFSSGLCTGAAISNTHILTAAHCFLGDFPEPFVMSVTGDTSSVNGILIPSSWFFDNDPASDIAILEVEANFISRNQIRPLTVKSLNSFAIDPSISTFFVGGFGINPGSDEQIVSLPSATRMNFHNQEPGGLITMVDNAEDTGNACVGDSGAPLVLNTASGEFFIVGITSTGVFSSDCNNDPFTRFTDIANANAIPLFEEIGINPF